MPVRVQLLCYDFLIFERLFISMQLSCPSFKSNRSKFYEFWISSRCSLSKGLRWKGWKEWFYLRKKQINDIDMKIYRKQWKRFIFKMPYSECRTNKHGLYLYIFSFHPYKAFLWFYICVPHWFQEMSWSFNSLFLGIILCKTNDKWYL